MRALWTSGDRDWHVDEWLEAGIEDGVGGEVALRDKEVRYEVGDQITRETLFKLF